ncbi:MAG: hypothetical protein Q8P56_07020 [Candidatus Uhrbacteria bacterium]|nr:hypothetical protein [Candidatus Uhrbacteria bacterium]
MKLSHLFHFHQIQKDIIFKILSADFFFHPLYMEAFFALHRLTAQERREYQYDRLKHLLRYAYRAIPYWHKHIDEGIMNSNIFDIEKFERLPILTRETLIKYGTELVVQNLKRHAFRTFTTSGSTGIPKKFVGSKVYCQKMVASEEYFVNFLDADFRTYGYMTPNLHLKDIVTLIPKLSSIALQKLLRDKNISALQGPLNRLLFLAEDIEAGKMQFKPKFVVSGSEFLTLENKKYMEKVFQCPVYNKYGCAEVGVLGLECTDRGGFHITQGNCYVEIVDDNGQPVSIGTQGKIVVTAFNNRLMPLIRYEIGDTGRWIDGECTCGLNVPRLFFEGRKLDYVKFVDGRKFSAIDIMRGIDIKFANIIAKQQIVQESLNKIVLKFVPGREYKPTHEKSMRDFIYTKFCGFPEIFVEVVMVSSLDNFKSGKHIIFKSYVKEGIS